MTMLPKPTRERDEQFLLFIKRRPCLVTGCTEQPDAHHVREKGKGGIGTKPSDRRTVPLCRLHHAELHQYGQAQFEADRHVILEYEIERLNKAFDRLPAKRERKVRERAPQIEVSVKHCQACKKNHPVKAINYELYGSALKVVCQGVKYSVRIKK